MALESRKYHHSTQNQKLHRTVVSDFFRKKSPFPLCFHFTNIYVWLTVFFSTALRVLAWPYLEIKLSYEYIKNKTIDFYTDKPHKNDIFVTSKNVTIGFFVTIWKPGETRAENRPSITKFFPRQRIVFFLILIQQKA